MVPFSFSLVQALISREEILIRRTAERPPAGLRGSSFAGGGFRRDASAESSRRIREIENQ